jgi:phosphatidylglycerol:prolipoprotein diacylglycerol transferase
MYPILFHIDAFSFFGWEIGPLSLFSHGIFASLGFLISVFWFLKIANKKHLHLEFIADHFFSLIFWSVVGARLGFVYGASVRYLENPWSVLHFWDGGYLLWSGIVFFLMTFFYHCYQQKEKIGQWLDVIIPAGIIAFAFETFGAFLAGKNYGAPTDMPWGIVFENPEVRFTIAIHPVQLYLLGSLLVLLLIIHILHKRYLRESLIGLIALALFAHFSFVTDFFRDDQLLPLLGLHFSQVLQLLVLAFSLGLIFVNKKRR